MSDLRTQIRAYIDLIDPPFEARDLMSETRLAGQPVKRRVGAPGPVLVFAVTFVVVLLAGGVTLLLSGPEALEPAGPPVFSWDNDDINEWVTEDEMTAALEELSWRYQGTDLGGEAVFESSGDPEAVFEPGGFSGWAWRVGPAGDPTWRVVVHDGDEHTASPSDQISKTDPRLPEGVVYHAGWGFAWGAYVLSGPNSDEWICIMVFPPGASSQYPDESEVGEHENMVFDLASMMLREMRWAYQGGEL